MILVFTGNGKGKTTAAIGQGIRAIGHGKKVFMLQFIKGKVYPSGEDAILPVIPGFTFEKGGKGFVGIMGDTLLFEEHKQAAEHALNKAREAIASGVFGMVILDEIHVAASLNLITKEQVLELAEFTPKDIDLVLTGRHASEEIIRRADLVTECCEAKHPFQQGAKAQRGVEF